MTASGHASETAVHGLRDNEKLAKASADEGSMVAWVTTTFGRVGRVDLVSGASRFAAVTLPAGTASGIAVLPGGGAVVGGADGQVAVLDAGLAEKATTLLDGPIVGIQVQHSLVMVGMATGSIDVLGLPHLAKIDLPVTNAIDAASWRFAADGTSLFGVERYIDTLRLDRSTGGTPPSVTSLKIVPIARPH